MKWVYITYAVAWLATGTAVTAAVIILHRVYPMWFLLIPLFLYIGDSTGKEKGDDGRH